MKFTLPGAVLLASTMATLWAQDPGFAAPVKPKNYVVYAAEPQTIASNKQATLELHFRVQDGFHVNSHTPRSELLIPTNVTLEAADGVKAAPPDYPAGVPYHFSFDPTEKLDVYQGPFTVKLPVVAEAGDHRLNGTLRYQACDQAACYSPKTLPVEVLFTAK